MESQEGRSMYKYKRAKRRSVIQMAKKFARKREHGGELDTETYHYIVNVLDMIRTEFPTMEDKQMFVDNVYEQTVGKEINFAKSQVCNNNLANFACFELFRFIKVS